MREQIGERREREREREREKREREREREKRERDTEGEEEENSSLPFPFLSQTNSKKKKKTVAKFDLLAKDPSKAVVASFKYGKGRYGGEATFVADPHRRNGGAEDAGFLVTYVFDEKTRTSDLVVLDAQDLSNAANSGFRVPLPARVPYGFHVVHVAEEELKKQEGLVAVAGAREE